MFFILERIVFTGDIFMNFTDFKNDTVRNKNKNFTFVKIRTDRFCCHCSKQIHRGTECLTINKKLTGRSWMCDDCVILHLNYQNAKASLNSVAFGDEGDVMACLDFLDETLMALEEAKY